jgi:hypothetical protein
MSRNRYRRERNRRILSLLAGISMFIALAVFIFEEFDATAPGSPVAVVVVMSAGTSGAEEDSPPIFSYMVELPDGKRQVYSTTIARKPGDRLVLTERKGRITGRIVLSGP